MAGEIEEPLRYNFQTILHSGSISFGRFESESLSWESKSSFSHNRYLEEVKKYSKPGSVTEKKAYFEAHFKRKALLKQSSSESQDGREFPTIENDDLHDSQESENGNDSKHSTCFDESPHSSGRFRYDNEAEIHRYVVEHNEVEDTNENSVDHTNEIRYDKETEIHRYDEEQNVAQDTNANSADHTYEIRITTVDLMKCEESTDVIPDDSVEMVGEKSEIKQTKPKLKPRPNEASNISAKTRIREIKGLAMKEKEKKSPRPASSLAHSGRKTSKSEESSTSFPKTKVPPQNKSTVKDHRPEKSLPGTRQTPNRTKQTILTPSKPPANQTATGFSFKSDQRAERRKEEKRAAAEVTQSNKTLNFKATPIPSFYKQSARNSAQNNVLSASKTPNRPRTASMAPTTKRAPSNSSNSSNPRPSSSTSTTNRNRLPEPSRIVQEKKKDPSSQKQKQHEAIVYPRVRGPKVGMKPGCFAVGVAT